MDENGPKRAENGQKWPKMAKNNGRKWTENRPTISQQMGRKWTEMAENGQKRPKKSESGRKWAKKWPKNGQKWLKRAKNGPKK